MLHMFRLKPCHITKLVQKHWLCRNNSRRSSPFYTWVMYNQGSPAQLYLRALMTSLKWATGLLPHKLCILHWIPGKDNKIFQFTANVTPLVFIPLEEWRKTFYKIYFDLLKNQDVDLFLTVWGSNPTKSLHPVLVSSESTIYNSRCI